MQTAPQTIGQKFEEFKIEKVPQLIPEE